MNDPADQLSDQSGTLLIIALLHEVKNFER